MKVLVTGGAGFIGGYVVDALNGQGHEPLIFDHLGRGGRGNEVFLGDIRDATAVTEAMAHADSWIHLAGVLGTQETVRNPRPAVETNMIGAVNVLEAAAQYDLPGVNIAVGNYWMVNPYSITKHLAERFCEMYRNHRGTRVTVVRAFNAYGPRQEPVPPYGHSRVRKIMPFFICRALRGLPIEVYGDGDQVMDMIHVRDVAQVLTAALHHTVTKGPIDYPIEAGSGVATSVLDVAQAVINEIGDGSVTHLPMRPGEETGAKVLADTRTLYDLDPEAYADTFTSLPVGVAETVPYYRERLGL